MPHFSVSKMLHKITAPKMHSIWLYYKTFLLFVVSETWNVKHMSYEIHFKCFVAIFHAPGILDFIPLKYFFLCFRDRKSLHDNGNIMHLNVWAISKTETPHIHSGAVCTYKKISLPCCCAQEESVKR